MPDIIISQDLPDNYNGINKIFYKYLIIINFIRLKYKVLKWINLNPKNELEQEILDLDIGANFHTEYIHYEIKDFESFSIRNAIYFLKQFTEFNDPLLIHCGAGSGRTYIQTILLVICRILTKALQMYKMEDEKRNNNNTKLNSIKEQIKKFVTDIFDKIQLNETITIPCNITTNNEIYDQTSLYIYLYNTMLISILYYITKQKLYQDWLGEIDISFLAQEYPDTRKQSQMSNLIATKMKYNLDSIKTEFLDKLNTVDDVKKYFFIPDSESVNVLKDKEIINFKTIKLLDNIDDI